MDQETLVKEQIDAGEEFLQRLSAYCPINAAFWARSTETGRLHLYVASKEVPDDKIPRAYGEVVKIAGELGNPNFDMLHVKFITMETPLARSATAFYKRFPKIHANLSGTDLGGVNLEVVYIYPPLLVPSS